MRHEADERVGLDEKEERQNRNESGTCVVNIKNEIGFLVGYIFLSKRKLTFHTAPRGN